MNNKILILGGDPNSVNSEIIYKSWKKIKKIEKKNIILIANYNLLKQQFKILKYKIKINQIKNIDSPIICNRLNIINMPLVFKNPFKVSLNESSRYVIASLNYAHKLMNDKKAKGIINCPIDKKLLKNKSNNGVTEYLANKCNVKKNSEVMMISNAKFSVVPLSTHIRIKDITKKITLQTIIAKAITLNYGYKKIFGFKPSIGILGLNPHNGELRKKSEETNIIIPAIKKIKKKGINVNGPIVPDTAFIYNYKRYDVIIGMYHDQVLTPFKALFNFDAINITLGLNYIRVSPDHGPAYDIIKKNKANYSSLLKCIKFINKLN